MHLPNLMHPKIWFHRWDSSPDLRRNPAPVSAKKSQAGSAQVTMAVIWTPGTFLSVFLWGSLPQAFHAVRAARLGCTPQRIWKNSPERVSRVGLIYSHASNLYEPITARSPSMCELAGGLRSFRRRGCPSFRNGHKDSGGFERLEPTIKSPSSHVSTFLCDFKLQASCVRPTRCFQTAHHPDGATSRWPAQLAPRRKKRAEEKDTGRGLPRMDREDGVDLEIFEVFLISGRGEALDSGHQDGQRMGGTTMK